MEWWQLAAAAAPCYPPTTATTRQVSQSVHAPAHHTPPLPLPLCRHITTTRTRSFSISAVFPPPPPQTHPHPCSCAAVRGARGGGDKPPRVGGDGGADAVGRVTDGAGCRVVPVGHLVGVRGGDVPRVEGKPGLGARVVGGVLQGGGRGRGTRCRLCAAAWPADAHWRGAEWWRGGGGGRRGRGRERAGDGGHGA